VPAGHNAEKAGLRILRLSEISCLMRAEDALVKLAGGPYGYAILRVIDARFKDAKIQHFIFLRHGSKRMLHGYCIMRQGPASGIKMPQSRVVRLRLDLCLRFDHRSGDGSTH
jgi:hypothetical protein